MSVDWFLALCACIGTCSAIGYGAFMLLVPFLHDGCNSSFRNGFAFSGRAVPTSFDSRAAWNECGLNAVVSPRRGQPPVLASHGVQQCTQDVHFFQPLLGLRWRDSHCGHCCWGVHPHTVRAPRVADGPQRLLPVMMASCVQVVCGCGSEQTNRQRAGRAAYTWTQAAVAWRCVEGRVALCAGDHAVLWGWDVGVRALHVPPNSGRAAMSDGGMKSCA